MTDLALSEDVLREARGGLLTVSPPPKPLDVRRVTDALKVAPPEPDWIIPGFMRRGELMVIAANRGLGKSWFGMQLAYRIGTGEGLFCDVLPVKRAARVLYCHGEIDPEVAHERWFMLTAGSDVPNVYETFEPWRLRVVSRRSTTSGVGRTETDTYLDAVLDPRLEEAVRERGIEVLVIDPWATFYNGNENNNDEVEAALGKLRDLSLRFGVAIVIIHHISKSTDYREPEDSWRGASRLPDWASTRVTLSPHYTEQQARAQGMTRQDARRYVDVKLLRRHAPTPDFSIRLHEDLWWRAWNAPDEGAPPRLALSDVTLKLTKAGGYWPSTAQAAADLEVSQATAKRFLDSLVAQGTLVKVEGPRHSVGYCYPGKEPGAGAVDEEF